MTHREDTGGWARLEELEKTIRKIERLRKQLQTDQATLAHELTRLQDHLGHSDSEYPPNPLVVFDEEDLRRLEGLIEKSALSPVEACALRQDIADIVVTFGREIGAILQEFEALKD